MKSNQTQSIRRDLKNSLGHSRWWLGLLGAATGSGLALAASSALADERVSLTVPVRKIVVAATSDSQMMNAQTTANEEPAATPAARMPQYQVQLRELLANYRADESRLRFVLATPETPLLIEADIRIDGQPFLMARERRVQEIMTFLKDPETYKAEVAKREAKAAASAAFQEATKSILEQVQSLIGGEQKLPESLPPEEDSNPDDLTPEPELKSDAEDSKKAVSESESAESAQKDDVKSDSEPVPDEPAKEAESSEVAAEADPKEPDVPAGPRYAAPVTLIERIERYTQTIGDNPTAEEVRWLLSEWVDGPVLLFLNDNFQRFRADQQPVFRVLDRDQDGVISAAEVEQSVVAFQECDADRNDVVEATELSERVKGINGTSQKTHSRLIYRLPDEHSAAAFLKRMTEQYSSGQGSSESTGGQPATTAIAGVFDTNLDGVLSREELETLQNRPADLQLRIDLNTVSPDMSAITLVGVSDKFAAQATEATRNPSSMTLKFDSFYLELLAVQNSDTSSTSIADQISLGAVNDGYAMLQEVDPNADGRFTIRELRQLRERLQNFDSNADGQVAFDEIRPTIRVCIGLGPTAHQPLAMLRETTGSSAVNPVPGPDWFAEMDNNKDYDLSRQEFPGTDEQFQQLDLDQDGLISSDEAAKSGV